MLGYKSHEGVSQILFDLSNHFLEIKQGLTRMDILCTVARALSFLSESLSKEMASKISFKLESYAFMHLPGASRTEIVELVKQMS